MRAARNHDSAGFSQIEAENLILVNVPERYANWLSEHEHVDRRFGHVYRYHSRSDAHSIALCRFIMEDLVEHSRVLQTQIESEQVIWDINVRFQFPRSHKAKTLDLAIGLPVAPGDTTGRSVSHEMGDVLVACEAKSVMTEHGKSQPRIFDELNSAHGIVHAGRPDAIAAGIAVVNIAETFASPLRQTAGQRDLLISRHSQPEVTERMVRHLRGLPLRDDVGGVGFDAYATIVINCDNLGPVTLWTSPPAPQPGDADHYGTFVQRIVRFYGERFA